MALGSLLTKKRGQMQNESWHETVIDTNIITVFQKENPHPGGSADL
jgi:hypothetical protein